MILHIKNIIAALLLFWPFLIFILFILFIVFVFISIFIGGTLLITFLFIYGIYASLRDFGIISWISIHFEKIKNIINLKIRENIRKSFLIINDFDLDVDININIDTKPIIYICSPHGLYGFSWFIHFCTPFSDWSLPKPQLAIHSIFFKIPFIRELFVWNNCIEATEKEITRVLKEGKSVAIIIGGIRELLSSSLEKNDNILQLFIRERKGYSRIASSVGANIIPLITIGENELFPFINSTFLSYFQKFIYKWFHIALPIPTVNSIINWISIIDKPLDTPLKTYFLKKINTININETKIREELVNNIKEFSLKYNYNIEIK